MDQREVEQWLQNTGERSVEPLLDERMPKMAGKLTRAFKKIESLLDEVQQEFPDAYYYVAGNIVHLMLGATHDNDNSICGVDGGHQERIAWQSVSFNIDGGDW